MADVYKAFDLSNEFGEVAVKILRATGSTDTLQVSFERERRALGRLSHPAIVPLLDSGVDDGDGHPFLVFPWIEGRLQRELAARGAMVWEDWWHSFGREILQALEVAHRDDVQHRDLKPANVLIDPEGRPRVIDFGIAKIYRRLAPEATVDAASAPFTPPEPVAESPGMTRDTHAWAALTVFAISGHDPYAVPPEDPYQRLRAACDAASARLPIGVAAIVERCLSSERDRRPQNAMVLAADLEASLEQDRRQAARRQAQGTPAVHVIVRRGLIDALESELEMFSA
ncbi:MAG: serine/threonine-protein kinase, partial [Aliidongia sp.]